MPLLLVFRAHSHGVKGPLVAADDFLFSDLIAEQRKTKQTSETMENYSISTTGTLDNKEEAEGLSRSYTKVIIFICLYVALAIVIIIGNSLVIAVFRSRKKPQLPINFLLASLAMSDLMVGAVSIPLWVYSISCPQLKTCSLSQSLLRRFYQPFDIFSAHASIVSLTAISLERYFAISWPIRHRKCPTKFYYALIFMTWLYALGIAASYSYMYTPRLSQPRALLVFMAGFIVPLVTITITHTCTYLSVRSMRFRRNNCLATELRRNLERERKTAKTVGIVTALFVIAWLPFFVISMLFTFCRSCLPSPVVLIHVVDFVKWMQYSNSAVNPFVYAYRNVDVRQNVLRLIRAPFRSENGDRCSDARAMFQCFRHRVKIHEADPRVQRGRSRSRAESRKKPSRSMALKEVQQPPGPDGRRLASDGRFLDERLEYKSPCPHLIIVTSS